MNAPSVEALLREVEPLRRFVRSLLRDPHGVDDVVQEALVVGLRDGPADRDGLRPWLGRVARRLCSRRRLGEARRWRRERAAARGEAVASTAELADRAACQRSVVDAVLALPEPYKSTVLLRYWEGLPPRRIAAHQGVPVATVHTRLQRANEKLRGALDREWGGRAAWSGFLLAWFDRTRAPLAPKPIAAGVATAAGGAVLIAASLLPPQRGELPAIEVGAAVEADVTASVPPAVRAPQPQRVAVSRVGQDPVAKAAETVSVRTVDEHGEPVSGVELQVWPSEFVFDSVPEDRDEKIALLMAAARGEIPRRPMPDKPLHTARSDRGGTCSLPLPDAPSRLVAVGPDHQTSGWVSFEPRALRQTPELVVVLHRTFTLDGQVLDAEGLAAAGVTLQVSVVGGRSPYNVRTPPPPTTDADGRFTVRCEAHGRYLVSLWGAPYSAEQYRFFAEPGESAKITLRLVGAASARGVLLDEAGAPVNGAWVWAFRSEPSPGEDRASRHRFGRLGRRRRAGRLSPAVAGAWDLRPVRTAAGRHGVARAASHSDRRRTTPRLRTAAAGAYRARWTGSRPARRPLAGVSIQACTDPTSAEGRRCIKTQTDRFGRFSFPGVEGGGVLRPERVRRADGGGARCPSRRAGLGPAPRPGGGDAHAAGDGRRDRSGGDGL